MSDARFTSLRIGHKATPSAFSTGDRMCELAALCANTTAAYLACDKKGDVGRANTDSTSSPAVPSELVLNIAASAGPRLPAMFNH